MQSNIVSPHLKYKTPEIEALHSTVESKLKQRFGEGFISSSIDYDFPVFTVKKDIVIDVLEYLYHDSALEFKFLTTLCTTHQPDVAGAEFGLMYQLHNLPSNFRIRVKCFMQKDDVTVRTATSLFRTANWMERQEFDFFGVVFEGHPNLKRILNMDEMNYFPMRKEYPVEDAQRQDKDNSFFGR
jgi:NADH-quinone oxidoreductase subunit C